MTTYRYNVTVDHDMGPTWTRLTPSDLRTVMWTCESKGWHYTITALNMDHRSEMTNRRTAMTLPEWADGWGPTGSKHCGRRTVIVHAGWGAGTVTCCQVTGWTVDRCAQATEEQRKSQRDDEPGGRA